MNVLKELLAMLASVALAYLAAEAGRDDHTERTEPR